MGEGLLALTAEQGCGGDSADAPSSLRWAPSAERGGSGGAASEALPPTCLQLSSWPAACGWSLAPGGSSCGHLRGRLEPPCLGHDRAGAYRAGGLAGETARAGVPSPSPGGWDRGPRAPAARRGPRWRPQ